MILNQDEGQQLVQRAGDSGQQQGAVAGGDQRNVRQTGTRGSAGSSRRAGWLLIIGATILVIAVVALGIIAVIPWAVAGPLAVAIAGVAAVIRLS